ncbi:MAG: polyprenyl synthetase family protein [Lachnospiraceae bacterium]|nr:polyprenyl synthetase family protein [Lachnospiraceae bacterium]
MKKQIEQKAAEIEKLIQEYLPKEEGYEKVIYEAMNYTMLAGGKRIRPMLMQETYRMFGGTSKVIEPFMAAIEMIHTYSLIHDDLPALDNDDYRRGRKTAHVVFGEDMAILAGDALLNYAFEVASRTFLEYPECSELGRAFMVLAKKPGVSGMIGGQVVDVALTGQEVSPEEMMYIYRCKTGALIEASMMIGAILAGADEEQVSLVEKVAANIGLAFQIQDDILDIVSDSQTLGKPVGSDAKNHKYTYATVYGITAAKAKVEELTREAVAILEKLPADNPFLPELLNYLVQREK